MSTPPWTSRLKEAAEILIIHHWDSDGISSASILTKFIKNVEVSPLNISYVVPSAGTYRLLPGVNLNIPPRSYSLIAVLDYSVPKEDILNLKEQFQVPIVIYDHHLREPVDEEDIFYYNPVARGQSGKKWPATTWVLKKYLELPVSDLIVMGIAGDLEERFFPAGFKEFPEVKEYLDGDKEKYFRYVRAKSLIDIHYKENDERILPQLASTLLELGGDPSKIENIKKWRRREEEHKKEIADILSRKPDEIIGDSAAVYKLNTPKSIISAVTRRLAAKTEFSYVIVMNSGLLKDRTQIYVRLKNGLTDKDTALFKRIALDLGGQAGGKDEVAGIIINDNKVDLLLDHVRLHCNRVIDKYSEQTDKIGT